MTINIRFFNNDALKSFLDYMSRQGIIPATQSVSGNDNDKLTITGDFNPYDVTRIWSQVEVIRKCLPSTYKSTQLIYMEIYMALNGNLDHVALALQEMPLFDMYLDNFDYDGARSYVLNASKYLSVSEKTAILSILP